MESVASVATIAGIAMNWTRIALLRPIAQPMRTPRLPAGHRLMPCLISARYRSSARPNIEPTDRSISRIEIRKAMPAAMIPT